jgi:6-phospho-beta-glucosidase
VLGRLRRLPETHQFRSKVITILGGSAHSTPMLVDSLTNKPLKNFVMIRLAGRNRERLSAVARACSILGSKDKVRIQQFGPDEWDEALVGSDVVLVQIRAGDYDGRRFDETFPLQHGVPGDEGLGPGGLSAAHRAWPELAAVFERIQTCAPHAYTLLLSSPGSLLVRAAKILFPNWVLTAICELPFTTLQYICAVLGHTWDEVTFEYTGVNHVGWLYDVYCNGEDLLNSYVRSEALDSFPLKQLVADSGAFPLKYLRLHYEMETAVEEQRKSMRSRAEQLSEIASHSVEIFRAGDEDEILRALRVRPADWYSHAVAPLLRACIDEETSMPFFLSIASASGDVRERCYYARDGRLHAAVPKRPPPASVSDLVDQFVEYERVAAEAVLDGSEQALAKAVERHPWVTERLSARALAHAIMGHSCSYWERRNGVYV